MKFLIFLTLFFYSVASDCPSSEYVPCASEGGDCRISDTIKEGYMSYGTNGRFNLIPFTNTNTDGTDIVIECDNDHGDIIPGRGKYCCYIAADTGFDNSFHGTLPESNQGWNFPASVYSMRYGANNRYVYRVIYGAIGWCRNSFFNDPVRGTGKHCNYDYDNPPALDQATWTLCANEGNDCPGIDSSSAHWIRYGDNGNYYYRLIISQNDGKIPCNNNFFDDPLPGTGKYCWRSQAQYTFKGATGSWKRIPSCGGCASNQFTKTIGIEELQSSEMTNSWSWSLTTTVEASYGFSIGGSASVSLSATVANEVTNTLTTAFTHTTTLSTTYTCTKNTIYQWITDVEQNNGITSLDFTINTEDTWCTDSGFTPQCPPGYCLDDNCQSCTQSISGVEPMINPNDPNLIDVPVVTTPLFGIYLSNEMLICIIIISLLIINIICLCGKNMQNCGRNEIPKYGTVKSVDTEFDSENNPLNI